MATRTAAFFSIFLQAEKTTAAFLSWHNMEHNKSLQEFLSIFYCETFQAKTSKIRKYVTPAHSLYLMEWGVSLCCHWCLVVFCSSPEKQFFDDYLGGGLSFDASDLKSDLILAELKSLSLITGNISQCSKNHLSFKPCHLCSGLLNLL